MIFSSIYKESWTYDWSEFSPNVRDSVLKFEEFNELAASNHYKQGIPKGYNTRFWIMKNANIKELYLLTKYPNENVKAIAYLALLHRDKSNSAKILNQALSDTTSIVLYYRGCVAQPQLLIEFLVEMNTNLVEFKSLKSNLNLSENEFQKFKLKYERLTSERSHFIMNYAEM